MIRTLCQALLILVLPLALLGCKQGEGDRCQVQADCDDGLTCTCTNVSQTSAEAGGICHSVIPKDNFVCPSLNGGSTTTVDDQATPVVVDLAGTDE